MRTTTKLLASLGLMAGLLASAAEAMPIAPATTLSNGDAVTLVSGGCGPFAHRTPFGECRPNGGPYGGPGYGGPRHFYGGPGYGPGYDGGRRCFIRDTPYGPRRICRW